MKFSIYGPFDLPRTNNLVDSSAPAKKEFWTNIETKVPGLSAACGCYVYVLKAKRGALPWYVGLTTKGTFKIESYGLHQINHYNQAIGRKKGVKAQLFFLPKVTPTGRFAKPSPLHNDIEFLETFMFGIALNRNKQLRNAKNTKLLKNMVVPSILNSPQRPPTIPERNLKSALGL